MKNDDYTVDFLFIRSSPISIIVIIAMYNDDDDDETAHE